MTNWMNKLSPRAKVGLGTVALLALGATGGAGAVAVTRPAIEMAPIAPIAIGTLAQHPGIVTVKGRIAEVYGNRFIVSDATGKTMVDAGRFAENGLQTGAPITVQGRYIDGQLHASFLVDQAGMVEQVGPVRGMHGHHGGPGRDHDRGPDGGPDREQGMDAPPPPPGGPSAQSPAGCAPNRGVAPPIAAKGSTAPIPIAAVPAPIRPALGR